jgi:hypothetical protein
MFEFIVNNLSTILIGATTLIMLIWALKGAIKVNKSCCGNCQQCEGCKNGKQSGGDE